MKAKLILNLNPLNLVAQKREIPYNLPLKLSLVWTMAKGARENIKMKSTESSQCYWTVKNKRNTTERIELKKYDKTLRKHVVFKEAK
jgi:large subunit ribosomal protein L33